MPSQLSQAQLEREFCRDFDRELERANLSLSAFHKVLNQMGVPDGNGAGFTVFAVNRGGADIIFGLRPPGGTQSQFVGNSACSGISISRSIDIPRKTQQGL
jgi:hypothetical protein